ncbi:hypothetical protein K435DRAFT_5811 [Dendrothele bispora CBS 962.96]|uniref:Uncharacterized protein n=1 Tax=Dendrothele bispora (strain CBS 962.96) TaxID=1314807 RepID=A0A4V4HIY1_DENBC|nr:hypothetical protein K435DRAFT_5811 [Dendrothele bispora CBS 962.96]
MSLPHQIVIAKNQGEIEECYKVRIDVFHHEQGFPLDTEIDDLDPTATHFLLRHLPSIASSSESSESEPIPIGTIRGTRHSSEDHTYYKLSRLAVLKPYRQYKFGRELVAALHDWIIADAQASGLGGSVRAVCHSQIPVKGFYSK